MLGISIFLLTQLLPVVKDQNFTEVKKTCLTHLSHIHGWCSEDKAQKMMDLIYQVKPKLCVEIGVFGGSSIWPQALALKYNHAGLVYAIDPWDKDACIAGYEPSDPNYKWWSSVDLEMIYKSFVDLVYKNRLNDYVKICRSSAQNALSMFNDESIDILHIDGNHTKEFALSDAYLYFPKVKKGGYIWFDDMNWSSTSAAQEFLFNNCEYIEEYSTDTFALFRK